MANIFSKLFSAFRRRPAGGPGNPSQGMKWAQEHAAAVAKVKQEMLDAPRRRQEAERRTASDERAERAFERMAERDKRIEEREERQRFIEAQHDPEYRAIVQGERQRTPQSDYMVWYEYRMDSQELFVGHDDGSAYGYSQVTPEMARSLYRAGSTGTWMWDNIRIRGTLYGHRVPYWLITNPLPEFSGGRGFRLWASNVGTATARDEDIQRLGQFKNKERTDVHGRKFQTWTSKFFRKEPVENTGRRP